MQKIAFLLILLGAGIPLQSLFGADTTLPSIVLTSRENGTTSESEFQCSGTIHGYIRLAKRMVGHHSIEGIWILPSGKVLTESHNEVDFPSTGRSTAYVWFSFPERSPLPGTIDPDGEKRRLSYNGQWRLGVRWDDQSLLESTFTVHCN